MTQSPQALELLGNLNDTRGQVRLRDLASRSEAAGLPQGLSPVTTFLGTPICQRDQYVGDLHLMEKEGEPEFTREDEHVAAMFAAHAASTISNSQRYEEAYRAKVELETLMDISPVAVSVFDARMGQITFVNQETRRILGALGIADEELDTFYESLRFARTDGTEIGFTDLPGTRSLQTGETVRAEEVVILQPNGDTITTLVNCAPLFSEAGEIVSLMSVSQDLTPLEDLERQRGAFLGMVSEELRAPLLSIKGSVAALRNESEPVASTESAQLLRIIDQQADLMRGQVNSLIELTQIETGSLSLVVEPTDVTGFIEEACRDYLKDHAALAIQLNVPDGAPVVMADRYRMSQVLHNFLRQAANHSNESTPVEVSASVADIHVVVSVSVDGLGATPEEPSSPFEATQSPQIFEKLTHAHFAKVAEMSTNGEGLAIAYCRGVVEAHGGRITTDINEQKGKIMLTFTLPTVEDEIKDRTPASSNVVDEPLPATADEIKILVSIEDPRLARSVRQDLFDAGYDTVAAAGMGEVEKLASLERPELIVLDIVGREEESFRILRGARQTLNLPAIVLCDRDDEEYVVRVFDMGADGYMVKPFSSSELIARINATLRRLNAGADVEGSRTYQMGDVRINFYERTVDVSGQPVPLTATEYKLLAELADSAGRVLTQSELLRSVWGAEYTGEPQLLRSYIKSLRQKLGDNARRPSYIFTAHGIGYRMARPDSL